jgi:ribonuclease HI
MHHHLPKNNNSKPLSSNLWVEDQHHLSQELAGSENSSREDQTREQAVQDKGDAKSDNMEVQEPSEPDIISEEQLQVPTRPVVTISPRANALLSSQIATRLQPHLPPYEWSFWTDACLRGPKPVKLDGCGFCVVHRRLDNSNPSDGDFAITWWQSCFVARNIHQIGHAEMLAVAQALEMAVDQCERISGTVVTKARMKMPGAAEEIKRRAATIAWPMPKVVNVFTDSQQVLDSLDCCWLSGRMPGRRSPMRHANAMIEALSDLGVRVHLQWVPGHAGDVRNRWAHEGARNALKPQFHGRKVYTRKVHRVHWRRHKDRTVTRPFTAIVEKGI